MAKKLLMFALLIVVTFSTVFAEDVNLQVDLKYGNTVYEDGAKITLPQDAEVTIYATSDAKVVLVSYILSDGELIEKEGSSYKLKLPEYPVGTKIELMITAKAENGQWAGVKSYEITYSKSLAEIEAEKKAEEEAKKKAEEEAKKKAEEEAKKKAEEEAKKKAEEEAKKKAEEEAKKKAEEEAKNNPLSQADGEQKIENADEKQNNPLDEKSQEDTSKESKTSEEKKEDDLIAVEGENEIEVRATYSSSSSSSSSSKSKKSSKDDDDVVTYRITTYCGNGGEITPTNPKVEEDDDVEFYVYPYSGYRIAKVIIDGRYVNVYNHYTFRDVEKKHSIEVYFEPIVDEYIAKPTNPIEVIQVDEEIPVDEYVEEYINPKANWRFEDVNPESWYASSVDFVVDQGLFEGTSETTFAPNMIMNRAMCVTMLYRMAGKPNVVPNYSFGDLHPRNYFYLPANWAVERGIMEGLTENRFGINEDMTREVLVTALYRMAKLSGRDVSVENRDEVLAKYLDINYSSENVKNAFAWAVNKGIIQGRTEETLVPNGSATRAEVATIMTRYFANI